MENGISERRKKVDERLRLGTNHKCLRGGYKDALSHLRKAYNTARKPEKLHRPWPELTAFRRGCLLFRKAQSKKELEEVDCYLTESRDLGAVPRLYRIAVLHRLIDHPESTEEEKANFSGQIDLSFRNVISEIIKGSSDGHGRQSEDEGDESRHRDVPLQSSIYNALEITSFFIGKDFGDLEGLDGPYSNLGMEDGWYLVGPDPKMAGIIYTRELALIELKALGEDHPNAILFQLSAHDECGFWRRSDQERWTPIGESPKRSRLMTCMLLRKRRRRDLFLDEIYEGDDDQGNRVADYRQVKQRLKSEIAAKFGVPREAIMEDDESGIPRFGQRVEIYGAIDSRVIPNR